jgi:F-type H+-transporting ATPase subunit b
MHLDLWTLLLQAINLAVLLALLRWLLYRPLLAVIDARRQRVADEMAAAQTARQAAQDEGKTLAAQRKDLEGEREQVLAEARQQAGVERDALLAQARTAALATQAEARQQIDMERQQAGQSLLEEASSLALDLATRLLDHSPAPADDAGFVDELLDHLEATPAEERQRWLGEATPPAIALVCASTPSETTLQQVNDRLTRLLGIPVTLKPQADPGLLRGAELHFPHGVLALSWSAALADAQVEMQQATRKTAP